MNRAAAAPRLRTGAGKRPPASPAGRVILLAAFAVAMGHLEAVVVVYIREILGLIPTPEDLTPAVLELVPGWIIAVEQTREAATIIMLVCLALLAGRNLRERLGAFLFAFGVWDITYYAALKLMIGWPQALTTMDLLFLIPGAWYAPVWVPLVVSCGLIAAGLLCFRRGRSAQGAGGRRENDFV